MNNFPALFANSLSRMKGILVLCAIVSVCVAFIGGLGGEVELATINLGYIDRDGSAVSADFARYMTDDLGMGLVLSDSVDDMNSELIDKRISGLVEVPAGFEAALLSGSPEPVALTFTDDYANEAFTRGYIDAYMQSLGLVAFAASGDAAALDGLLTQAAAERPPVAALEKDDSLLREQREKFLYRSMLSFFTMFSFVMAISVANMVFADRRDGTYRRIKAGRVTSFEYASSISAIGLVQMLLIVGPSLALYALSGGDSGVPFAVTAGLLTLFAFFITGFGLLAGLLMPTQGGIIALIIAVTTITSMLGGAFFPVDMAPKLFKTLGQFTPQHWFFSAVENWQTGLDSPIGPTLVVLLAGALCFVLAGVVFAGNRNMAR